MREFGKIQLPKHFIDGVGLDRNECEVEIHRHGEGELKHTNISCAAEKTLDGCRSNYHLGRHRITGCPLRSNHEHGPALLKKNLGIVLVE